MARSLTSLWLKNLRALTKVQKSQQKLFNSVTAAAKRAAKTATKAASKPAVKIAKPTKLATKAVTRPTRKAVVQAKSVSLRTPHAKPQLVPALPGSWTRSYTDAPNGHRMAYWLYLPTRGPANATKPLPLVVMLHGCTQTAPEFAQGTRMNVLAQRKGFAVLYPQQLVTVDANRCWQWYERSTHQGGDEAEQVADMLNHVVAKHALDATRVYLAGMSAGAALAQIIALRYPYRMAAVGMHSGPVFGMADNRLQAFGVMQAGAGLGLLQSVQPFVSTQSFPPMPAMLLHGDADSVVRVVNQAQVAKQFCAVNRLTNANLSPAVHKAPARASGSNPRRAFQMQDYRVDGKTRVTVCRITGLEHAWSGGDGALRFNDSAGPDASALLWAFFAKHRRSN